MPLFLLRKANSMMRDPNYNVGTKAINSPENGCFEDLCQTVSAVFGYLPLLPPPCSECIVDEANYFK